MSTTATTTKAPAAKAPAKQVTPRPKANTGVKPGKSAPPAPAPAPRAKKEMAPAAPAPEASTDRVARVKLAKAEKLAHDKWVAGGSKGDEPSLTNFNELTVAGGSKAERKKGERKAKNPRRAEANECRAKNSGSLVARENPKPVTEEELVAYVAKAKAEHPDSSREDELEFAVWCDNLRLTRNRWNAVWGPRS